MPDAAVTRLAERDFSWHDGVLVDVRFAGFGGEPSELRLIVDLYPDAEANAERQRYLCVGEGLSRFFVKGDMPLLVEAANSGNIDFMRMDYTATTEILVLILFGGMIEAEASTFTLAELKS
jgi:hypothetical protein